MHEPSAVDRRHLLLGGGVLLALTLLHDLDHLRQGRSLDLELWGVGGLAIIATVALLILTGRKSDFAVPVAFVVGTGTVLGVAAVHVAPTWWRLSDSYGEARVDAFSWVIIIAMMTTGAVVAAMAAATWRRTAKSSERAYVDRSPEITR